MLWIRNTAGKKDAVLTMAWAGFMVVLAKVLLSGLVIEIADAKTITLGTIDGSVIAAILTPTLGAYIARRYTDTKHGQPPAPKNETES